MDDGALEPRHREPLLREGEDNDANEDLELLAWDEDDGGSTLPTTTAKPIQDVTKPNVWVVMALLVFTIAGFVIQTEMAAYYQEILGWNKSYASFYIMHSSLALPWVLHLAWQRFRSKETLAVWKREYYDNLLDSISTVSAYQETQKTAAIDRSPWEFIVKTMALVTVVLFVSGISWFVALALTTPADLTAIYNCSTFFAAAFSVPLLKEKLSWITISAVALSIAGTFIIAYGDTTAEHPAENGASGPKIGGARMLGNIVSLVGAVAFGLYEVLFKKFAHSSRPQTPSATLPLTFFASALIGFLTFVAFWPGLIILHVFNVEPFVMPTLLVGLFVTASTLAGCASVTAMAVLVVWTSPVFASVASLLSVFFTALADWYVFDLSPSIATYVGGAIIMVAFGLMASDTLRIRP